MRADHRIKRSGWSICGQAISNASGCSPICRFSSLWRSLARSLIRGFIDTGSVPEASREPLEAPEIMMLRPWRFFRSSEAAIHRPCRCLEASRSAPKLRCIVLVSVWRPPRSFRGATRIIPSHDQLALSVFGRLTSHVPSCLSVFGGLPKCPEVTIIRACACLEASQGATRPSEPSSAHLRRT